MQKRVNSNPLLIRFIRVPIHLFFQEILSSLPPKVQNSLATFIFKIRFMSKSLLLAVVSIFVLCLSVNVVAQNARVVGYLPYYQFGNVNKIAFEKLTHVCIAFANPDMAGNLDVSGRDIAPAVAKAKAGGAKVLISLAGGALTSDWWAAWQHHLQLQNRAAFIRKIILYLERYDLNGVDLDLEWQYVNNNYSGFAIQLSDSLRANGKLFTAALPGTYRYPEISEAALARFDFINMMAYDLRGPWNPNDPGPHSPYSFAENAIKYWRDRQGVTGERLTLGLPFYGYDFADPNNIRSFTYRSMVDKDPANAQLDQVGQAWYNGIPTIIRKTELALRDLSGVMIWELGQDDFDEYSLLDAIYQTVNPTTGDSETVPALAFSVFPNPFSNRLFLENLVAVLPASCVLFNGSGSAVFQTELSGSLEEISLTDDLPKGFYFLKITSGKHSHTVKLVKG